MVVCVWLILHVICCLFFFFFFKQKTAYELAISDWSSDVGSSDLTVLIFGQSDHSAAEIRAVLSTSRRPACKTGDLLALHASFSRSDAAFIIDLGWHQRALAHAARLASQSSTLTVFSLVIASTPSAI